MFRHRWPFLIGLILASHSAFLSGASERRAGDRDIQPAKRPMTAEDLWKVKRVGAPTISPEGKWCAVDVTTYDIDKNDSTSDIWLLATDGKTQKQLTRFGEPTASAQTGEPGASAKPGEPGASATGGKATHPKWSPDGKHIAFLGKRGEETQIYLISPDGGEARQLTKMPMAPSGIKWGADSKAIYCIGLVYPDTPDDESFKKKETERRNAKSKAMIIADATFRYWDHWIADGKRPVVFAVDADSGKHKNLFVGLKLSLPPYEPTEKDYDISPDGKELCFVADSAKEIGMDVNYDLYTMEIPPKPTDGHPWASQPKNITPDNPANDTNPVYSPDGKYIAFLRQKIKFFYADRNELMVHQRASGKNQEAQRIKYDRPFSHPLWAPNSIQVYLEEEEFGYAKLYRCGIGGFHGDPMTDEFADRALSISHDGKRLVFLRSSFGNPAAVFATDNFFWHPSKIDTFNDDFEVQWKLGKVDDEYIKNADKSVHLWLIFPPDFDPAKKWPLVQMVHGGPHSAVLNDFNFRWNPHLWAAQGYVVACVNFHGSTGFGQEFTDSITGDLGTKPMIDIMKATDWLVAQPYIDKDRLAAAGASYGGFMMAWLNGHTDRFKCYIDHAGVYNWHSMMASDIIKPRERALGTFPWGDLAKIDAQSPQRFAANFKTPTLISHGEKDFRVPVTQGLEYYNTLKQKGVPTRLIYFPDENHWILKPQNSILWHREVFAWLEKHVGKGATP